MADDDVVVLWGPAYTMNPEHPWAEAVVISQGRIVYVGNKARTGSLLALNCAKT